MTVGIVHASALTETASSSFRFVFFFVFVFAGELLGYYCSPATPGPSGVISFMTEDDWCKLIVLCALILTCFVPCEWMVRPDWWNERIDQWVSKNVYPVIFLRRNGLYGICQLLTMNRFKGAARLRTMTRSVAIIAYRYILLFFLLFQFFCIVCIPVCLILQCASCGRATLLEAKRHLYIFYVALLTSGLGVFYKVLSRNLVAGAVWGC